jgi:hypothetical protein
MTEIIKHDQNISELFEKYKDNPYILQRLQIHLINLPAILEGENKRYEERVSRINELTLEQDNFYKVFLSKHQYFYMPYNNIFYEYDGKTYQIVKEDDIHHHLLSTITDEGKLTVWKHKTKQNILRQIKDRTLFKSVPETYTIQNVLSFLNTIFETKTEIKYFLTVIGDCILRKNTEESSGLLFFINSSTKKLVSFIDSICCITTGNSIMSNFISKYHESHNLLGYRLIKTNENFNSIANELIKDVLNKIGIDLISVAAHYSERYGSSDQFLINLPKEDPIKDYIMFFSSNTTNKIVEQFVSQCIEPVTTNHSNSTNTYNLSWKNIHYIWKLYLSSINVPNMMYSNNLKTLLKSQLVFSELNCATDIVFTNVTSKFLPNVSSFLSFWDKHITILTANNNSDKSYDDEYEIDEISSIYKLTNKALSNSYISDKDIIKMIWHYFYPSVEVIDNKYITNIHCNLWSKHDDINEMLDYYKQQHKNELVSSDVSLISFDDLYQNYKSYIQAKVIVENSFHPNVSKHFFEKFLSHYLASYIKFDKFVSSDWLQT